MLETGFCNIEMWICLPSRLGNGSTRRVQSLAGINHRLRRIIPLEQLSQWVNRMILPKNDSSLFNLPSYFRDVHTNVLGRFWGKIFSRPLGKRHQGSQQIKNFERHTFSCVAEHTEGIRREGSFFFRYKCCICARELSTVNISSRS